MNAYLQSMGKRKRVLISMIVMSVTYVVGDFLSVYVFHGGMFGIGLASSVSYLAACAVSLGFFLKKDSYFCFSAKRVHPRESWEIFRGGSSVLLNQAFITLRTLAFNLILLGLAGNRAVAAFAAYMAMINVIFSISTGFGATTLMLSSIFYSEEDKASFHALVKEMMIFTTEVTAAVVIIAEICSPWLLRLFLGSDPELISFAVPGLRLALLGVLPNMLSNIFKHYFLGIRKEKMTNLIAFLQGLGFNLPIVWALSRVGGLTGFWIGAVTAQAATFLAIVILCWRQYGGVSFSPAAFSFLKRDFGISPDRFVTIAISDRPAAIAASKQLCDFCKQKGFDGATAMKIGLCVEEITMNILRHGFGRDRRAHNIEARLMLKEDRMLLRIRDDCFHFDPMKYLELHQNDDAAAHIGLRMVMRMVQEANYGNL